MPRWVIVVGVVALVLALAVIALLVGGHGPAQHQGAGAPTGAGTAWSAPSASAW